ncbi:helicase-exonuclease AddAB subunit AddB [Carnobacterium gallinarum]|uniref:helicase-exonuclease AddAB subunit AddB n=1 Tax=Carnobacterium gallinarum TaxID=2749 RepID=UPI00054D99EE|nr:helicase-exonuclease AddAB subunit AddB [Carnobacterium gallinarum]
MALQFVLGRGNTDKQGQMVEEIATTLQENKQAKVFYLVPDHIQFEMEMLILKKLSKFPGFNEQKLIGAIRLQIFSFSRLAWFFLQDTDVFIRPQLTNAGLSMLVRKLLLEHEEELSIYRGEVRKSGFVQQLTDLFLELRSGRINEIDLIDILEKQGNSLKEADFKLKLKDILILYRAFEENLLGKYIEQEDILTALTKKIEEATGLENTTIYIDGYSQFNAQEQALVRVLMEKCKDVTISLVLDKGYPQEKPALHELFHVTGETYFSLYQLARNNHIPIRYDIILQELDANYSEELNQLEEFWLTSTQLLPNDYGEQKQLISVDDSIEIWAASNKQAEVTHVAKEIRRLVKSGAYRFQDIIVMTRNITDYQTIINPIFKENEIELFNDGAETMNHHPLVEFLLALLAIKKYNWRYQDVMRLLRTELLIPDVLKGELSSDRESRVRVIQQKVNRFRSNVDITENVILAYGYEGHYWTMKKPWHYTKFVHEDIAGQTNEDQRIEGIANQVRDFLTRELIPLFNKLEKVKNGETAAKILYTFLESSGVSTQLAFWRDQAIEENHLETSKEHEQVWNTFLQLLDEYVEVLGKEAFQLESFYDILATGFENAKYSMIPPSMDQVIFSGLTGIRAGTAKVAFLLGSTEGNLPGKTENKSVLNEEDRQKLMEFLGEGKYLKSSLEATMAAEPYLAYLAFTTAAEKLIFTYPTNDDSKEGPKISPYVKRIAEGLKITIQEKVANVVDLARNATLSEQMTFVGTQRSTLTQLLLVLRHQQEINGELPPLWSNLYRQMKQSAKTEGLFQRLLASLTHKNEPVQLKSELVKELYGTDLYTSVSRMENFYSCHFKHYATYGLGLKERDVFELSAAGTGEFFHDALDQLFKSLNVRNLNLNQLDEGTLKSVTNDVLEALYGKPKYTILSASNRMNYIRYQLGSTIKRIAWTLANQSRRSGMSTVQTEVLFGQIASQKGINGLVIPLETQGNLFVRGKIDRVDTMEVNGDHYLSVVDYKSSAHVFDYRDAYYGLAMQMITYLDTALINADALIGETAKPAGAFYLHVKNPFISTEKVADETSYQEEMLKPFKLDGILLEDEAMLQKLDLSLEPTQSSLVYPYRQLKNETLKSAKFVNPDEMNALRKHNQQLFEKAGNKIMSGATNLNPYYKDKQRIACGMCPFRSVCEFDVMLPENNYHRVEPMDAKEVLRKMENQEGETD